MNRKITNVIRFIMDECLPPILRDSRWFMYPFFYYWFKGKNIELFMDFKSIAYDLTPAKFNKIYEAHLRDKKFVQNKNRFVLPYAPGSVGIVEAIPDRVIVEAVKKRLLN